MRYNALLGWLAATGFAAFVSVVLLTSTGGEDPSQALEPVGKGSFGLSSLSHESSRVYTVPDTSDGDYESVDAPDLKPVPPYVPGKVSDEEDDQHTPRAVSQSKGKAALEQRPVTRDDGKLRAEDGTWVEPEFYPENRDGKHLAEDGTWVNEDFYDSPAKDDRVACRGNPGTDEGDDNRNGWINPGESGYERLCR